MRLELKTLILLLALPLLFFGRIFFGESIFIGDFSGSDLLNLHLPFRNALTNSIGVGNIPIWEKGLALGFPIFAEGQTGILYPANLIFSVLRDPVLSLNLSILAALGISLISSYLFFRLKKNSTSASVFGAISYSFSSFFIARIKHLNLINAASFFPLLLIFTDLYFEKRKLKYTFFGGIVFALSIFAGHPQISYYSFFAVCLYSIYKTIWSEAREGIGFKIKKYLIFIFVIVLVGLGISAVQTVPTFEFAKLTRRLDKSLVLSEDYSYNPRNIITLISPYFFGNPKEGTYIQDIKTFGVFWENSTYIGLLPLFLVFLYIPFLIKRRDKNSIFFLFLAIFSYLVMLGVRTPLIFFLAKFAPLFSVFRFPNRFNLFFIFSLVFLAVRGFDFFFKYLRSILRTSFSIIFILLICIDLYIFANTYIGYIPSEYLTRTPELINLLNKDKSEFRIYSLTQYQNNIFSKGWKEPSVFLEERVSLPPNDNILYGIDSFNDRGWFEGGLSLAKRNDLESFILLGAYKNPELIAKVLGMYNVKYLISLGRSPSPEIKKIANIGEISVYENSKALPRTYLVPETIIIKNDEEFFKVVSSQDFNPEQSVILQGGGQHPSFVGDLQIYKNRNRVENAEYGDRQVKIEVLISDPGYLVLSDVFYPGWKASIDGKEVPIYRANYTVRAIRVNPGDREISFFYKPQSFEIGKKISLGTILVLLVVVILQTHKQLFRGT